ncbi:MAG TPA: response regulator transcription factor [Planctomycetota bacterium]|nr:response regulator transcription factor [Planctomycetota bacterium]
MKVLVIEDSERLQRSLLHGLKSSGFAVEVVGDGEEGLAYARHGVYDVIVLDLMLPKMDGLDVLRKLRASGCATHVLILSAKDQVEERVEGLHLGADDYLTKPFAFEELVARIRALVRRKFDAKDPVHRIGPLKVDTARRAVVQGAEEIALTPQEYAVLEYLAARRGRVVPKSELLDHLYAGDGAASENAVEVLVHQLRRKLPGGDLIQTRRGHGYLID